MSFDFMYFLLDMNCNSVLSHLSFCTSFSHTMVPKNKTDKQTRSPLEKSVKKLIRKNVMSNERKTYKEIQNIRSHKKLSADCAEALQCKQITSYGQLAL